MAGTDFNFLGTLADFTGETSWAAGAFGTLAAFTGAVTLAAALAAGLRTAEDAGDDLGAAFFVAAGCAAGFLSPLRLACGFLAATGLAASFLAGALRAFLGAAVLALRTFLGVVFLEATLLGATFFGACFLAAAFFGATFFGVTFFGVTFLDKTALEVGFLADTDFGAALVAALVGVGFLAITRVSGFLGAAFLAALGATGFLAVDFLTAAFGVAFFAAGLDPVFFATGLLEDLAFFVAFGFTTDLPESVLTTSGDAVGAFADAFQPVGECTGLTNGKPMS